VPAASAVAVIRDERRATDALSHTRGVAGCATAGAAGAAFAYFARISAAATVVVVADECDVVLTLSLTPLLSRRAACRSVASCGTRKCRWSISDPWPRPGPPYDRGRRRGAVLSLRNLCVG
jgi:hypothetical protein